MDCCPYLGHQVILQQKNLILLCFDNFLTVFSKNLPLVPDTEVLAQDALKGATEPITEVNQRYLDDCAARRKATLAVASLLFPYPVANNCTTSPSVGMAGIAPWRVVTSAPMALAKRTLASISSNVHWSIAFLRCRI
jgi:hypothetical protein